MAFPNIKKFLNNVVFDYPPRKGVEIEYLTTKLSEDGKTSVFDTFIGTNPEAEAELMKFIKFNNDLSSKDKDKLWDLITDFGSEKYCEASDQAAMDNAGADL